MPVARSLLNACRSAGTGHAEQAELQRGDRGAELMVAYACWRAVLTVVLTGPEV